MKCQEPPNISQQKRQEATRFLEPEYRWISYDVILNTEVYDMSFNGIDRKMFPCVCNTC